MKTGAKYRAGQAAIALAVLAGSAAFVLRFSYSTSFVWPGYQGYDSAIFQLIGKAWAGGTVPYAELFDHKGPLIFWINMLGYLIYGRAGILVVQTLSLAVSAWGLYRLGREYLPRPWALGAAGLALVYLARTFDEGNMTEEYSLPFLTVSLWLAVRYCKKEEEGGAPCHPWRYAAVYGLSFGAILMLRVTSAVSLCCFVLVICVRLAAARQWKNLGVNALGFVGGFAAATGPFAVYFAAKGALGQALYGTLWYNIFYATRFSIRDYYAGNPWAASTLRRVFLDFGAPLFVLAALCVFLLAQKPRSVLAWGALLSTAGSMYLLFSNRPYVHYFIIAVPLIPLAGCLLQALWRSGRQDGGLRRAAALGCAALCGVYVGSLAVRLPRWGADSFMAKCPAEVQHYNIVARQMAGLIPEEERDSVLGYNVDAQFYLAADLMPCQKYFVHQDWQAAADPAMQAEIERLLREEPPKWVAAGGVENAAVAALLKERYAPVGEPVWFEEYAGYTLYRRKQ